MACRLLSGDPGVGFLKVEGALVQRPAAHSSRKAGSEGEGVELLHIRQRCHAARRNDRHRGKARKMLQSSYVNAALHAVAFDIGIDDECSAIGQQAGQNPVNGQAGIGNPSTGLELAALGIQRNANAARKGAKDAPEQPR